ncbi:MAG: DUF5675 family protein [Gammaproteobacteria bacterium]
MIQLQRMGSTPWGTFGTLRLPDGTAFPTVEPRWEYNAIGKSCIPAGVYLLAMRASPIVRRTSGGEFNSGWEVTGVLNRSLIMIHPGNWAGDSNGCILPGRAHTVINGVPGVSASRAAFKDLMQRLARQDQWTLSINWINPETQGA